MKDKATTKVKETFATVKRVVDNTWEFVLAISLVLTATYNAYDLAIRPVGNVEYYVRAIASGLIAFEGARAIVRFLDKKG